MKLREIAHGRTGDKGNTCNISVIAYDRRDYPRLRLEVTAARVRDFFDGIVLGEVVRYELPQLGCVELCHDAGARWRRHPLTGARRTRKVPQFGVDES